MARYEQVLCHIAEENPDVVVMTAENRAAIRSLPGKLGARFVDVGICEQTLVGAAAGLALRGRIPVVHALATFLTMRAFEFIRTDVGIARLPVKLVGGVPGFLSEANGPTHQALEDVALMRSIPGMEIFCPADEEELADGLPLAIASPSPVYIRFNERPPAVCHRPMVWGVAETFGSGHDFAILTYGFMLCEAAAAVVELERRGLRGRLVSLRTLAPLDTEAVLRATREVDLVVTLEDHFLTGGLFSIVSECWARAGVAGRLHPIALESHWFTPAMLSDVIRHEGFAASTIADRIESEYRNRVLSRRSSGDDDRPRRAETPAGA